MDYTSILIFVIISAIIGMIAFLLFRRGPDQSRTSGAAADYAEALNLLLAGKREPALEKLKVVVSKDSNNIDAYLKIGDILRESGRVDRAINVHKYLTARQNLSSTQHNDILRCLAEDYLAAKDYDKALGVIDKAVHLKRDNLWAREMRVKLHEQRGDWSQAFQAYKEVNQNRSSINNGRLALYKVQEGLQLIAEGKEKEAQGRFKDAIRIDPVGPPGYINLADSYRRESRKSDALRVLKEFVEKVPAESYLAFERIKQLLYEGGVYGEIENLYTDLIRKQPDNLSARLGLAELYRKKGQINRAVSTCQEILEKDPANKQAKKYLVRLYHKAGDNEKAVREALDLIDESLSRREMFACQECGYQSHEAFWRCPECEAWQVTNRH